MSFRALALMLMWFVFATSSCTEGYNYVEEGEASYYANLFIGRKTASGDVFFQDSLTAAHKTLPLGTIVKVTNVKNGKSIEVKINDRGPFAKGRVIDLTRRGADSLDFLRAGLADVVLEAIVDEDFLEEE